MGRQYIDPVFVSSRKALFLTRLSCSSPALQLPTQCAVCHDWDGERICNACRQRFMPRVPRCTRCALQVPDGVGACGACLVDPPAQDGALAAMDYAHPWDRLIGKYKFNAALDLSASFAQSLERAWQAACLPKPDLIVPVPLSDQRLRERGFNQSWEIARRLASRIGCKADALLLLRIKDTPHQLAFPVDKRSANVKGAFAIEPRRLGELRGKIVAVLDDVMTTGATVAEVARTLRHAGAAQVHAWVVARTPTPGE
jgi:ComF family protein